MSGIIILFSLVFFAVSFAIAITPIVKHRKIQIINVFNLMYSFTYGFLPFIVFFMNAVSKLELHHVYYDDEHMFYTFLWLVLGIIGFAIIQIVCTVATGKKNKRHNATIENEDSGLANARLFFVGFMALALGLISMFLWTKAYGSITSFIAVSDQVRSGAVKVNNTLSFFKHTSGLVCGSAIIFGMLFRKKYHSFISLVLLILSFAFSLLFFVLDDGRMAAALFLVKFIVLFYLASPKKINFKKAFFFFAVVLLVGFVFIMHMDEITYFIRHGTIYIDNNVKSDFFESALNEFSYIISAGQTSIEYAFSGNKLLIVDDIGKGLFAWLPSSLKPAEFIDIWKFNTVTFSPSQTSTLPTDFISTSIYDLSIIGFFVFSVFWGTIIGKLDRFFSTRKSDFWRMINLTFIFAFLRMVNYSYLYDFILGMFSTLIVLILWAFSKRLFCKRRTVYRRNGFIAQKFNKGFLEYSEGD